MRTLFILILVALVAGVGVVATIESDPGYILLAYGNYTVETSLWVGILVLLVIALVLYLLVRLVKGLFQSRHALAKRRHHRSVQLTNRGLINYIEGNWQKSRRQLLRGARHAEAPLLNYLYAAQSSEKLGDSDKVRAYLSAAESVDADAEIAVELTQAEIKLDAGQYKQAVAALVKARHSASRHPRVLSLLYRAYSELEDWEGLAELLPDLERSNILDAEQLHNLKRQIYLRRLQKAAQREDDAATTLQQQWRDLPGSWRHDQDLLRVYVALLITVDAHEEAGKVAEQALNATWDSELVRLYAFIQRSDSERQLTGAEGWLKDRPDDAALLLCLGRLAARSELWGKARDYLERSYALEKTPEVCAELGRLLAALGEPGVSARYYEEGLLRDVSLPQLPMPEPADISYRLPQS